MFYGSAFISKGHISHKEEANWQLSIIVSPIWDNNYEGKTVRENILFLAEWKQFHQL